MSFSEVPVVRLSVADFFRLFYPSVLGLSLFLFMQAFIKTVYGGPEVLRLAQMPKPVLEKHDQVIVRVKANSANPADWHILRGQPWFARFTTGLFKPTEPILGADFAGVVEAVGEAVTTLRVGDRVFGEVLTGGAFAEYVRVTEEQCALMPEGTSFSEMAAVPVAGLTALQALVMHGALRARESVLIHGSTGGVGHFAVQIAKALGASVTAVCSKKNADFVKRLGADHALFYDEENIHRHTGRYDLVVDIHGSLTYEDYTRMGHRGVMVGFTTMKHMAAVLLRSGFGSFPIKQFTAECHRRDLEQFAKLIREQKVRVFIEKEFPFQEIPAAIGLIEDMRTRGKVVMNWE